MKKIPFFVLLFIGIGILIYLILSKFVIDEIRCESQYGFCSGRISQDLSAFKGKRYFRSINKIGKYLKGNVIIENSTFQFKLPNRLSIYIIERKPVTAIKTDDNVYYLISKDGIILSMTDTTVLPYMIVKGRNYLPGWLVEPDIVFSLKILRYMEMLYNVREGNYREPDGLEYHIQNGPSVIFPKEGNEMVLIGSLRLMIQNVSRKDWEYGIEKPFNQITIDLRYKNPVIK